MNLDVGTYMTKIGMTRKRAWNITGNMMYVRASIGIEGWGPLDDEHRTAGVHYTLY